MKQNQRIENLSVTALRRRAGEAGFTMLEIMATVVISLILSSIMVPQFIGMTNRARLNGATRELVSDIMQTKMAAISKNRQYQLELTDKYTYTISRDDNQDGTFSSDEKIGGRDFSQAYSGVTLSADNTVVFNPKGTVVSAEFTLVNNTGKKKVRVNIAGRVKVES
ncbi:MAG: prepilin-type N-terminal cleavage/methylation domain-containing protein [Chitinivibrionales bacterium]|nr:prepilin-type N-terminal cleavage/methylation domain-containing protein [Chitinivibrionales bacterium]